MGSITRAVEVGVPPHVAFLKFVNELSEWWPKEYTWSQSALREMRIDAKVNGLCSEIGPNGFRCDWGTVTALTDGESIQLKWQISPTRAPVPDPGNASDIRVDFVQEGSSTMVKFVHFHFENHGKGAEDYRRMMDAEPGWDYILNKYKAHCERVSK